MVAVWIGSYIALVEQPQMACPSCNRIVHYSDTFCPGCGSTLHETRHPILLAALDVWHAAWKLVGAVLMIALAYLILVAFVAAVRR